MRDHQATLSGPSTAQSKPAVGRPAVEWAQSAIPRRRAIPTPQACGSLVRVGMPVVTLDDHFIGVVQAVRPGELGIDTGRVHAEPINVPCEDVRVIDDGYIVLRLAFPALEDLHPVVAGAADDDAAGAASPEG